MVHQKESGRASTTVEEGGSEHIRLRTIPLIKPGESLVCDEVDSVSIILRRVPIIDELRIPVLALSRYDRPVVEACRLMFFTFTYCTLSCVEFRRRDLTHRDAICRKWQSDSHPYASIWRGLGAYCLSHR